MILNNQWNMLNEYCSFGLMCVSDVIWFIYSSIYLSIFLSIYFTHIQSTTCCSRINAVHSNATVHSEGRWEGGKKMRKFTHIYARKLIHMHTIIQMGKARVIIMYVIIQEALLHYCLVFHTSNNLWAPLLGHP